MKFDDIKKRILKNYKLLVSTKIISGLASVITLLLIARFLGVKEFGVFAMVISSVEILNILFSFRVWDTTVKFIGDNATNKQNISSYISFSMLVSFFSSLLSLMLIFFLADWVTYHLFGDLNITTLPGFYSINFLAKLISIYAFSVLFISINDNFDGILRTYNQYNSILKINIITNLSRLVLVALSIYYYGTLIKIFICFVLAFAIGTLLRFIYLTRALNKEEIDFELSHSLNHSEQFDYLKFMSNAHFSNILNLANDKNLGVLVVGYFVGPFYAGLYRVARAITKIIRRIMDPALEIIFPEFVKLNTEKDFQNYKKVIVESVKMLLFSSSIVGLGIYVFSSEIIVLFFGTEYIQAESALFILIIAMIIHNGIYWINPSMLALGRAKYLTIITIITALIYCSSLFYLVRAMQHDGAALSLVIRNLSILVIGTCFYIKVIKEKLS
ncbi:MAG: hypothetical protein CMN79_02545 [Spirochaetales bacterium]|nr:hypothetical protein [Spirochaetales bacterium]|tara:strand:+ start:5901 stop:7232 length:1332 start_codon:yes stop_codon:yes gene_type:complete